MKDKDEKRVYREVKSDIEFKVVATKDGEKGEEAIITVPPEVVKKFSREERDTLTAMVVANSEKEKQDDKGEKKYKRKGAILLPLLLVVPLMVHSCGGDNKTTIIETQ